MSSSQSNYSHDQASNLPHQKHKGTHIYQSACQKLFCCEVFDRSSACSPTFSMRDDRGISDALPRCSLSGLFSCCDSAPRRACSPFPLNPQLLSRPRARGGRAKREKQKEKKFKKIKVWERAVSYASKRYDKWIKSCFYLGAVSDRRAFIYKWLPLLHPAPAERLNRLRNE